MEKENERRVRVKICGITRLEDARFAAGAQADFLGFVFHEPSPRAIDPGEAGAIVNWIEGPQTVGVFVNRPPEEVNDLVRRCGLDLVQLHGNETPDYCRLMEKPVIKTFHLGDAESGSRLQAKIMPWLPHVDYLLFDTRSEKQWGGTGRTFDWSVLKDLRVDKPFFLSGGISEENVGRACREIAPFGVDLSSSLESEPGRKDFGKLEKFFERMAGIHASGNE